MPKMIKKRKDIENQKVNIVFDIDMVNALIKYVRCEYVPQPQITALHKLLKQLDFTQYRYNQDILDRLNLISTVCTGICEEHIKDDSVLTMYVKEHLDNAEEEMHSFQNYPFHPFLDLLKMSLYLDHHPYIHQVLSSQDFHTYQAFSYLVGNYSKHY